MKDSLIGGRCISVNGIYENILCLDVKSLYPAAMAFYDQPYGQFRRVQQRMIEELGIYYVRVIPHTKINSNFFPVRYNNKITYNNYGSTQYNAWYTSVDIDIDTNYSIKAESDVDFDEEEAYKIWDTEYMLIKQHKESEYSSKPIQNGVFTLSWARHHMKLLWDASTRPDTECIYSDTDSIFKKRRV
ncbi:hypothetical protein G9O61_00g022680 [Vairimorpha ceranae]|nr:hypothetical protein G9O61_00g022680 [Vairimorpha ceranae]